MPLELRGGGLFVGPKGIRGVSPKWDLAHGPSVHKEELKPNATISEFEVTLSEDPRANSMPCASWVDHLEEDKGGDSPGGRSSSYRYEPLMLKRLSSPSSFLDQTPALGAFFGQGGDVDCERPNDDGVERESQIPLESCCHSTV